MDGVNPAKRPAQRPAMNLPMPTKYPREPSYSEDNYMQRNYTQSPSNSNRQGYPNGQSNMPRSRHSHRGGSQYGSPRYSHPQHPSSYPTQHPSPYAPQHTLPYPPQHPSQNPLQPPGLLQPPTPEPAMLKNLPGMPIIDGLASSESTANRSRSSGGRRSSGSYQPRKPGATFFIFAGIKSQSPALLVIKENYKPIVVGPYVYKVWGPPGGGGEATDLNKFTTGEREFSEETGRLWQTLLNGDFLDCFTWYNITDETLTTGDGDRWVLLLEQDLATVSSALQLHAYTPTKETVDIGWILVEDMLRTNFVQPSEDMKRSRNFSAQQPPVVPVKTYDGRDNGVVFVRPEYANDTQALCKVVKLGVQSGKYSSCSVATLPT